LKARVGPALSTQYDLDRAALSASLRDGLRRLAQTKGMPVSWLPELSIVTIETAAGPKTVTLVHNDGHTNVATMFNEQARRVPEEDTLTVVPGFLGAYPNALFKVSEQDLPAFTDAVTRLSSEADYAAVMSRWGVRRTDPAFWAHSDLIYGQVETLDYADTGVLDYSRIENR
jgi:hypothetical protein